VVLVAGAGAWAANMTAVPSKEANTNFFTVVLLFLRTYFVLTIPS
jgi:hypothetical protein